MHDLLDATLLIAVQSVDAELRRLREEMAEADGDDLPDLQELVLSYSRAARDLEAGYRDAMKRSSNLPPYESLLGG